MRYDPRKFLAGGKWDARDQPEASLTLGVAKKNRGREMLGENGRTARRK